MKCRIVQGDSTLHINAKIICSDFTSTLTTSEYLKFAFKIKNPSSIMISTASVPITIYSFDPSSGRKDNWNIYENAIQIGTYQDSSSANSLGMISTSN